MAKSAHSTTTPAPAQPGFIDPTTLPNEYAMRVRGDCLAPAIKGGDAVLVDQRQSYKVGDLVCVFLEAECVAPGNTNVGLKRLVMNMLPGITFPYRAHPDSNIMPVLVCEQDNPHWQYTIPADQILAIHRCMGLVPDDVVLHDPASGERRYKRAVAAGWSRRDLLAGAVTLVPAAGLAAMPALAAQEPDPIFAAIEAHKAAAARFEAAIDREIQLERELPQDAQRSRQWDDNLTLVATDDPRWIEAVKAYSETCNAVDELAWAFVENPPTTAAGAAALLAYVESADEGWFPDGCEHAIVRVLAGARVRTGGAS